MWDLDTIIRINNEKNSSQASKQKTGEGDESVLREKKRVPRETFHLRGLHEGEIDRCSSQRGQGEKLS